MVTLSVEEAVRDAVGERLARLTRPRSMRSSRLDSASLSSRSSMLPPFESNGTQGGLGPESRSETAARPTCKGTCACVEGRATRAIAPRKFGTPRTSRGLAQSSDRART